MLRLLDKELDKAHSILNKIVCLKETCEPFRKKDFRPVYLAQIRTNRLLEDFQGFVEMSAEERKAIVGLRDVPTKLRFSDDALQQDSQAMVYDQEDCETDDSIVEVDIDSSAVKSDEQQAAVSSQDVDSSDAVESNKTA